MTDWSHSSVTIPFTMRKIVIPGVVSRCPVGGLPKYAPR